MDKHKILTGYQRVEIDRKSPNRRVKAAHLRSSDLHFGSFRTDVFSSKQTMTRLR
jgi:hypothetical protein